jgi:hypothetical protein
VALFGRWRAATVFFDRLASVSRRLGRRLSSVLFSPPLLCPLHVTSAIIVGTCVAQLVSHLAHWPWCAQYYALYGRHQLHVQLMLARRGRVHSLREAVIDDKLGSHSHATAQLHSGWQTGSWEPWSAGHFELFLFSCIQAKCFLLTAQT